MKTSFISWANVDRIVHEPARLIILALLQPVVNADFLYLLHHSGLTKGNLSSHLNRLEEANYISVEKRFRGKVPQTIYSLTPSGRDALETYLSNMRSTIDAFAQRAPATG